MPSSFAHLRPVAWIAAATLLLRLPMFALPGLGRDEAAYLDWARHGEWAYSPLLQLCVRACTALPLPLPLAARLPSMMAGIAVLFLFDALLRARRVDARVRFVAVFALAVSPWQSYVGALLHPDDLQLLTVLLFAWAWKGRRAWWMALAGGLALWAKPSGLLVGAFAAWALVATRSWRPLALLALLLAVPLSYFDRDLFVGLLSFARMPSTALPARVGLALLGLVFLGGPLLLWALGRGLARRPRSLDGWLGVAFVAGFGVLAVANGQVKANWILPAALLLWPAQGLGARWTVPGGATALLLSALMILGFTRPDWVAALESRVRAPRYLEVAGEREREVSLTRTWAQRLAEYRRFDGFCASVAALAADEPVWIFSDDYGLAAQWAAHCPTRAPRLVFPLDPVYTRQRRPSSGEEAGAWVLAVHRSPQELVPGRRLEVLGTAPHPVTAAPVTLARIVEAER